MSTTISTDEAVSIPVKKAIFPSLTEDWWAVILGGAIIFSVLLLNGNGVVFHMPVYQWSGAEELFQKVLSPGNLLRIAETGLVFLALASFSVVLSGGQVIRFAAGFTFLYRTGTC